MRRFLLSCGAAAINVALLTLVRGAFEPMFAALIAIWCVIEGTLADEVPRGERNLAGLATGTGIATFALLVVANLSSTGSPIGAIVMLAGIALRCTAVYTLGDRFVSELRADQPLIRRGVYRWMKHPSEAGLLMLTFGVCVWFGSAGAFAVWLLVLVPLTMARVRIENAFLQNSSSMMPMTTDRTGPSVESNT